MFPLVGYLIAIVVVIIFSIGKWGFGLNRKQKAFLARTPGPPCYPLIGNSLDFKSTYDFLPLLQEYVQKYGDVVRIWFTDINLKIIITGYKEAEMILASPKQLLKTDDYRHLKGWLGDGLLLSEPYRWKKSRKILTPAFHFQILEHFVDSFERPTGILMKKLDQLTSEKSFDVHDLISLCSLDMICESSMGITVNAQEDTDSVYVNAVSEIGQLSLKRSLSIFTFFDLTYQFTKDYNREKEVIETLHSFTNKVIQERKQVLTETMQESDDFDSETHGKKKLTLLDLLLLSKMDGQPIPDQVIREEVDTFMFAGHDTTSSGMSFLLYALADHPEIQESAFQEQKDLFGDEKDPKITLNELQGMKYLELCIKESLRLYPPAPIIGRELQEDIVIDGKVYPKGLGYYINIYGIHRKPEYYENPETFDPMRFTNVKGRSAFTYIPFSAGARNCIGQKYALLEMKYVISSILRHFKVKPATPREELQPYVEIVLKNPNGIKISLEKRP